MKPHSPWYKPGRLAEEFPHRAALLMTRETVATNSETQWTRIDKRRLQHDRREEREGPLSVRINYRSSWAVRSALFHALPNPYPLH